MSPPRNARLETLSASSTTLPRVALSRSFTRLLIRSFDAAVLDFLAIGFLVAQVFNPRGFRSEDARVENPCYGESNAHVTGRDRLSTSSWFSSCRRVLRHRRRK